MAEADGSGFLTLYEASDWRCNMGHLPCHCVPLHAVRAVACVAPSALHMFNPSPRRSTRSVPTCGPPSELGVPKPFRPLMRWSAPEKPWGHPMRVVPGGRGRVSNVRCRSCAEAWWSWDLRKERGSLPESKRVRCRQWKLASCQYIVYSFSRSFPGFFEGEGGKARTWGVLRVDARRCCLLLRSSPLSGSNLWRMLQGMAGCLVTCKMSLNNCIPAILSTYAAKVWWLRRYHLFLSGSKAIRVSGPK